MPAVPPRPSHLRRREHRGSAWLAATLLVAGTLAGCGTTGSADASGRLSVVAAFYPLAYAAERVGGADVRVTDLTPSGGEPHDVELAPQQVATLAEADLVLYEQGFQPAVDEAVSQADPTATLDVSATVPLRAGDPHLWLDPVRYAVVASAAGEKMAAVDPDHAAAHRERARALARDLRALDRDFRAGLQECRSRTVVVPHAAFGYLTRRYGLEQVALSGLTPEADPSPRRLAEVSRIVEERGVTTVFTETLVSPRTTEVLASDVGVRTAVLDPLESLADTGEDYFSVMRRNLAALRKGLGCT